MNWSSPCASRVARVRVVMALVTAASASSMMGCRLGGGPSGELLALEDAATALDSGAPDVADAGVLEPPVDATPPSSDADAMSDADVPDTHAALACAPDTPTQGCDPVCNTGCATLSRCTVSDTPHQGTCIGIWISTEGSDCLKTSSTDPCAVKLSCVSGKCRKVCYHDVDCAGSTTGGCCKDSIEVGGAASGFGACAACGP